MRKHWMLILPLVAMMSACGSGSFETEDIEENTATAADPKNKNKGPMGDVVFKDTVFMFGDVKPPVTASFQELRPEREAD